MSNYAILGCNNGFCLDVSGPGSEGGGSPDAALNPRVTNHKADEGKPGVGSRSKAMAVGSIQAPKSAAPPKKGIGSFRSSKEKEATLASAASSEESFSR